jgi:hypothetical protein
MSKNPSASHGSSAETGICRLKPTPQDPNCAFKGAVGDVTLKVTGIIGTIDFVKAKYNGTEISGLPSSQIKFTIVAGESDLDVVYGFSDTKKGAGTLNEVCGNETFLGNVNANTPAVEYHICA